jgi:ABC-2 type transport system permease protein
MMAVYTLVFYYIIGIRPPVGNPSGLDIYPLWLMAGLIPWTFFVRVLTSSMKSTVSNANLIKKVYFPRIILPLAEVGAAAYRSGIELIILLIFLTIFGAVVWPWIPMILFYALFLGMFGAGLGMLLSVLNIYFRDTEHFVGIITQIWQYMTPIMYSAVLVQQLADNIGGWALTVYNANPMASFVYAFRAVLYDNTWPTLTISLLTIFWGLVIFMVGTLVFVRFEKRMAEYL